MIITILYNYIMCFGIMIKYKIRMYIFLSQSISILLSTDLYSIA